MAYGLYIHIPFCRSKCPYCGFTSIVDAGSLVKPYAEAVARELTMRCTGVFDGLPRTVYIGGGTPSIVPVSCIRTIMERFLPLQAVECTIEANPESLDRQWLDGILELGVNRISIGVQSFDDGILAALGRIHSAQQARDAVHMARQAGFANISVDLMFGVPGQTMARWKETLNSAVELQPHHISCYSLSLEEDTPYFKRMRSRKIRIPGSAATAEMYCKMVDLFERQGFNRYEISNFSLPGFECLHNRGYWDFSPYLGVGASAHSFDGSMRWWNMTDPGTYCERCLSMEDPGAGAEELDEEKRMLESVMLGLRTRDGISPGAVISALHDRTPIFRKKIHEFVAAGFLEESGSDRIRFTTRGALVSDEIIADLTAEIT
ncbi:radical SAM family heme chaperone HemW [bacterium]|nr:radical SAM family heme chaperone HemW [bacterium]